MVQGGHARNMAEYGGHRVAYRTADFVGNDRIVFNIGGNKYRLIARIVYRSQTIFVVRIMTHEEYDLGKWKE